VGFSTVQSLQGLGVKVGEGPTVAGQRLASPAAVRDLLRTAAVAKAGKARA
jgi:trehalose 6-phosphate phosphatase